jgi:hypothetical protein
MFFFKGNLEICRQLKFRHSSAFWAFLIGFGDQAGTGSFEV